MEFPNEFMLVTPEEDAELTKIMREEIKASKSEKLRYLCPFVEKEILPEEKETLQKDGLKQRILMSFCKRMRFCTNLGKNGLLHSMRSMKNFYF